MTDWNNPATDQTHTNELAATRGRDESNARMDYSSDSNIPDNTIRWNASLRRFEQWNATSSAWNELINKYNINVDLLDGLHAGNSSGNIPISNGSSNDDLDADLLDGQHGSFYRNAGNLNAGTIGTARLTGSYSINILGSSGGNVLLGDPQNATSGIAARATSNPADGGQLFTVESSGSSSRFGVTQSHGGWFTDGLRVGWDHADGSMPDLGGSIEATGDVTAYASDMRLKQDITPLTGALAGICSISGVSFTWTDDAEGMGFRPKHKHETGVIAQEVQSLDPTAVSEAPFHSDYLTVQKERLIPWLIEAIKELDGKVKSLEEELREYRGTD